VNECPGITAKEGKEVPWHDWHACLDQFRIFETSKQISIARRHVFMFSHSDPFVCECYDFVEDIKVGTGTRFRVFQDPTISCAKMMNPIDHGFKDISQFPFKLAQISQTRRVYLRSKLQSLGFDDVLELYGEKMDKQEDVHD
jgi:hypothetical protein